MLDCLAEGVPSLPGKSVGLVYINDLNLLRIVTEH